MARVGDPAKLEERRESGRGEGGPVCAETDRNDAADFLFWSEGRDFRRSSRSELVLGVRLGAGVAATEGRGEVASWGDKREGEAGSGVAVAFARVRRFKESERSQWDWSIVGGLFALLLLSMNRGGGGSS